MALPKRLSNPWAGEIEVESVPDMGSVFCFQPVAGDRGRGAEFHQDFEEIKTCMADLEDDEEMREHLKLQCSQLGGRDGGSLRRGLRSACQGCGRRHFDLCLIDLFICPMWMVSRRNGFGRAWKRDSYCALMSAYDHKNIEQEALAAGVDDFLAKPVMRADIYRILQRLSGEISAPANEAREEENYDF